MKKNIFIILFFLTHLCNAQWITLDTMPFPLQEAPCVVLNDKIYSAGGISATLSTLQSMEIYDPVTGSWTPGVDMPAPRHHHAMCVLDGKIYLMGGYFDIQFYAVNTVFMYDPDSLSWYSKAPMPYYVAAGDAVAYNGKIYFIGGANGSVFNFCLEYDPVTDSWTQKSDMPTIREHLCVVVVDSLIYAIAGRGGFGSENAVEVYDPVNDSWSGAPNLPTGRSGCDAAVVNGKIFVMGGEGGGLVFDENQMYDPVMQTWANLDTMPHARHGLGVAAIGDTVYAIGGATIAGYGACNFNEAFVTPITSSVTEPSYSDIAFSVFPNPVNEELHITGCNRCIGENLSMSDMCGKLLLESLATDFDFKFQTTQLNPGIYFLKIGNTVKKIVKL